MRVGLTARKAGLNVVWCGRMLLDNLFCFIVRKQPFANCTSDKSAGPMVKLFEKGLY